MTALADKQQFRALVVDDDPIALRTVSFALQQEGFVCDSANDGEQALALMDGTQYDLLVTDLRMPNKHGHALAVDVLASQSRPKIVVHTSVDDPRLAKDLIVRGVDDVVYKPTNYAAFAAKAMGLVLRDRTKNDKGVEPADERISHDHSMVGKTTGGDGHPRVGMSEMKTRLSDVSKVRPVSHAALDVSDMVRSNSFDAEQVAAAVQRDPALEAKVLQLANNSYYNSTGKQITEIKQAVVRIGQKRIGEIALAMSAFTSITPESLPWMDLDLTWRRSVAAGIAVELLAKQGRHTTLSEGLLFSALMNSAGRTVLGTHYPKQYDTMVKKCSESNEALLHHEESVFPENHAEVISGLLADWNISAEVYEPLKHILNGYPSLSILPDPMRAKVELVKLSILLGQIAVGSWEDWELVEIPPRHVLERLGIDDIGRIIEQTEAQLPGIAGFPMESRPSAARDVHPWPASRQIAYYNLSKEPFDFLAEIVPSMGIILHPGDLVDVGELPHNVLVNRIGDWPEQFTARIFDSARCGKILFVRDAETMKDVGGIGTNIAVPCSYAALRSACWEVAAEF